jgi:hypothetical protein
VLSIGGRRLLCQAGRRQLFVAPSIDVVAT